MQKLTLSQLGHTWLIDLDGTLLKHNGYLIDGEDTLLPGAAEFMERIPDGDIIILLTSRGKEIAEQTEAFLTASHIPYHHIIYDLPYGERVLMNDTKPAGLLTALAVPLQRDRGLSAEIVIDPSL